MNELYDRTKNILDNHYKGEWDDSHVYDAIQDMIRDNGGKLYKYRRFDSNGLSLKSLLRQELYCSKPSKFNDPFDCRIGIDINALAKSLLAPLVHFIKDAFIDIQAIERRENGLETCSPMLQAAIYNLLANSEFCHVIERCDKKQLTDVQLVELLQQNPAAATCLFSTLIEMALVRTGFERNGISTEIFTKIFNSLDANQLVSNKDEIDIAASFVKANGITDDVDEITLTKQIFQMVQPEKTHELDTMDEEFHQLDENLRKLIDQYFYVGCLSEAPDNMLMWSHYGDSHSGFCVEYDFNRISLKEQQLLIFPVLYSEKRPPIPWGIAVSETEDEKKRAEYDFIISLLTKDVAWSYEKEWRILRAITTQSEIVSLPIVSCVYLGANCSQENKDNIFDIAHILQIPVKQMKVDRGIYKLHALPL